MARALGLGLTAATLGGFALAALAVVGLLPIGVWFPALFLGIVASLTLLALFFHPWLALDVAVDLVLLYLARRRLDAGLAAGLIGTHLPGGTLRP